MASHARASRCPVIDTRRITVVIEIMHVDDDARSYYSNALARSLARVDANRNNLSTIARAIFDAGTSEIARERTTSREIRYRDRPKDLLRQIV